MTQPSERLFEEVLSDARTKADRARRRGERDAAAARKTAAQDAQSMVDRILADARAEADLKRGQILATVEIEAQRERLDGLEESLQKVYELVRTRLASLDPAEAREAQVRLAVDAVARMPGGDLVVALPAASHATDVRALAAEVSARAAAQLDRAVTARAADAPATVPDGVVIRSADGRCEIVNSFQERLRRLWPELRLAAAARLFPELSKRKGN